MTVFLATYSQRIGAMHVAPVALREKTANTAGPRRRICALAERSAR
jgi:hypothetical protein